MARPEKKLSATAVKQKPAGKHSDGGGLWLVKSDKDTGKWVLRVVVHGRRREMGLGSIAEVGLAEAREAAEEWRKVVRSGHDPIKERARRAREKERNLKLLKDVAADAFEVRKAELKGDGKAGRWFTPLQLHVLPKLGEVPVAEIDQIDIRDTLKPLWHTKAETARKAMNRLGIVLTHAAALGLDVDLQAVDKARALLGKSTQKSGNIPAMPWQDVPVFYATLADGSITHLALKLLILTGVRSAPLRHMREDQISRVIERKKVNGREVNVEIDVWTIPGEMMKGRRDKTEAFRVPLSGEAMRVLKEASRLARSGWLFPSASAATLFDGGEATSVVSDMTLGMYMRRTGYTARPHGFRSSLRVYLSERCADTPHEVAETVLQHAVGNKVSRAYNRTDYLLQRAELMERWARWVSTGKDEDAAPSEDTNPGKVVPIRPEVAA